MRRPGPIPFGGYDGADRKAPSAGNRRNLMRARKKGASPQELVETAQLVYLQDGRCWLCGQAIEDDWSQDHVVPLALGGDHTYNNVRLAHGECNSAKGTLLPHEIFPLPSVDDLDLNSPIP